MPAFKTMWSLKEPKEMKIDLKDTALRQYQAQEKQRVHAAVQNMTNDEQGKLLKDLVNLEEQRLVLDMEDVGPLVLVHKQDKTEGAEV